MEAKKSKKADVGGLRVIFAEIGMVVALVAAVGVFSWGRDEKKIIKIAEDAQPPASDFAPITPPERKPPQVRIKTMRVLSEVVARKAKQRAGAGLLRHAHRLRTSAVTQNMEKFTGYAFFPENVLTFAGREYKTEKIQQYGSQENP